MSKPVIRPALEFEWPKPMRPIINGLSKGLHSLAHAHQDDLLGFSVAHGVGHRYIGGAVSEYGCVADGSWCKVSYNGVSGWSYAPYLTVSAEDEAYVVTERPSTVEMTTVTYEDTGETLKDQRAGATAGVVIGSLAAYAAGGPVGGVIAGGILGGAAGSAAVEPTMETVTYIESNPVETVYLDGEVAVGAGVPQNVTLYEIPSQPEYRYVSINGETVLVNPENNAIVRVIR